MKRSSYYLTILCLIIHAFSHAQTTKYWGTTSEGGNANGGTLFNTDDSGNNYGVVYHFEKALGSQPTSDLVENDNGRFYGTTQYGGPNGHGILFEFDPNTSNYSVVTTFNASTTGKWPTGSLIKASNGNFYGMTSQGGTDNFGTIFELDPTTNTLTKKLDFDGTNQGKYPAGSFYEANNGKLYATSSAGGAFDLGVLFEYDYTTNSLVKLFDFNSTQGESPFGNVIQHSDDKLYGMTYEGGGNNYGVVFSYDLSSDTYTVVHSFNGNTGRNPFGNLIEGSNGNLFGLTELGGTTSTLAGSLFEFDPTTSTYTQKVNFDLVPSNRPMGSLIEVSNGVFYGTTRYGGMASMDLGTLFEYNSTTDVFEVKFTFDGTANGSRPHCSLIKATDGKLYGTTKEGGMNNEGTLFQYDHLTETFTKVLDFESYHHGKTPLGEVVQAPNGLLYGTTFEGGMNNLGVLFEWNPNSNSYTKKVDFNGLENGENPVESPFLASNGKFYGLTASGGLNDRGVLYEWDPNLELLTKKYDFSTASGYFPLGNLVEANNGKLYGLTGYGGAADFGVLFEYDLNTNTYTIKAEFDGTNGQYPSGGSLVELQNNVLYGMTTLGGTNNKGVLFKYNMVSETLTKISDFDGATTGGLPFSSLTKQTINDKVYGTTFNGGSSDLGTIFEFDLTTETLNSIYDFSTNSGHSPEGSLIVGTNNTLFGLTSLGGANNKGTLFELDPVAGVYTTKVTYDGQTLGAIPKNSLTKLTENSSSITNPEADQTLRFFPNPTNGIISLLSDQPTKISVFNLSGQCVLEAHHTKTVDLSHLERGAYFIEAQINGQSVFERIILN
ncbi:MAG: T9SS type A sorting domain-containing protein [Flavobacteriales bacterium]|nr:T9SS type A sorting domain-containing protein [Flavobacteriales bacterium]